MHEGCKTKQSDPVRPETTEDHDILQSNALLVKRIVEALKRNDDNFKGFAKIKIT